MTEFIELRPVKARRSHQRSYTLTTAQTLDDSSEDESSSSDDESPIVFNLQSKSKKSSKRKNKIQTLPIIINNPTTKEKKKSSPQKHIQQFLINTQPPRSPKKKEIILQPLIAPPPPPSPTIQFVPISAPVTTVIERSPQYPYPRVYSPTLIDEYPFDFHRSYPSPTRRVLRTYPPSSRSVHLPRHARKLVNRFLSGMEYAHDYRVSRAFLLNFLDFVFTGNSMVMAMTVIMILITVVYVVEYDQL